ncbi:hypothetical protein [Longimicrobium sp.]|uniref:hypothetical protein n=1 Tax=Longimicrobium sp. TaxID=2029185 RepID=UPI002B987F21|nr:hypothetical protein [Longimicrobium sp.]HSU14686.1 hypothetical protein [Longimicrobium sp.]
MKHASLLPILLALATSAAGTHAAAQAGPFVGAGVGVARVGEPATDQSRVTPSLHLRAGWALSPTMALLVEGGLDGIGRTRVGIQPLPDLAVIGGPPGIPHNLRTLSVLASLQAGSPRTIYVRPGIGFARHTFASYRPLPTDGWKLETEGEWGPAAGLAVGREVSVIPGFPLGVEAVARWSGGEDSSSPRWSAGVQVVRDVRF